MEQNEIVAQLLQLNEYYYLAMCDVFELNTYLGDRNTVPFTGVYPKRRI